MARTGDMLRGIAFTIVLAAACKGDPTVPADAHAGGSADAQLVCADPMRMAEPDAGQFVVPGDSCACGGTMEQLVDVTFDGKGNAVKVSGTGGKSLTAPMTQCFLDLLKSVCYPSLAGATQTAVTCHASVN